MITTVVLDSHGPTWRADLDKLYQQLGGGQNPHLLPYHFLQAAFPSIGGAVIRVQLDEQLTGVCFALPYQRDGISDHDGCAYVIRYHALTDAPAFDNSDLQRQLCQLLKTDQVLFYDPAAPHPYLPTHQAVGALDIGRPDQGEAITIRELQQQIWGNPPEYLYPVDLHSGDFPIGTSLVARVDEAGKQGVAGFLFGFYKRGGPTLPADWGERWHGELRIESQVMGVLSTYRGLRIGYLLKKIQAQQAMAQGIGVIHWTVDPLQYANAALNFGLLRALCFNFTPDYYAFRNELNRGPASRLSLTWLIGSARVRAMPLFDAQSIVIDLAHHPEIGRVNQGWQSVDFTLNTPSIAIEIPANWTLVQRIQPDIALQWRSVTDRIFSHYLGSTPGNYVITDVGVEGEQRFLIAQRVDETLWAQLERM